MLRTTLIAALMSLIIGVAPASAGTFTLSIQPKGKDAAALSTGLRLYSLFSNKKNEAKVVQNGKNNASGIAQNGSGNVVGVFQKGKGHTSIVTQNGNNNALGVFQFGKNTSSNVVQNGGRTGLIFQGGW